MHVKSFQINDLSANCGRVGQVTKSSLESNAGLACAKTNHQLGKPRGGYFTAEMLLSHEITKVFELSEAL